VDIDGTICKEKSENCSYSDVEPNLDIIDKLRQYKVNGFIICLFTSRQMRTYNSNLGKITAKTLPVLIDWLNKYNVPFDEIHIGKPWCGFEGFYVDDKTVRPDEFLSMSYEEIRVLLSKKE
jgi:capsule biosynthesis phosphatase